MTARRNGRAMRLVVLFTLFFLLLCFVLSHFWTVEYCATTTRWKCVGGRIVVVRVNRPLPTPFRGHGFSCNRSDSNFSLHRRFSYVPVISTESLFNDAFNATTILIPTVPLIGLLLMVYVLLWLKRLPPVLLQCFCGYSLVGNTSGICPECGQRR